MVKITEDYVILVNDDEYTAAIDKHKVDKKGCHVYKHLGYYSTLNSALKGVYSHMLKAGLMEKELELSEAIDLVAKVTKELNDKIDGKVIF